MKPLNQPERRTRLWQFSLFYLLALLVPLGASYYLFSNSSIADENVRLKQEADRTHQEQALLVTRFDTLTQHLKRIDEIDARISRETYLTERSRLILNNQNNSNDIAVRLSELRNDTTQLRTAAHRLLARNVLRDFDFYRSTRNTIDVLRQDATRSLDGNTRCLEVKADLAGAKQEVMGLKAQVVQLQAALANSGRTPPPPPPTGGGNCDALKLQAALLRNQVDFAKADCLRQRALDRKKKSTERKKLLEDARAAFIQILQNPANDGMKQSIEQTLGPINVELGKEPGFFGFLRG